MFPTPIAKTSTEAFCNCPARSTGLGFRQGQFQRPSVRRMMVVLICLSGVLFWVLEFPRQTLNASSNAAFMLVAAPSPLGIGLNFSLKVHLFFPKSGLDTWSMKMFAENPKGITSTRVASILTLITLSKLVMNFFSSTKSLPLKL